jgi:hypothetical protein
LQTDNDRLSNLLAQANTSPVAQNDPSDELLRLRGEVGALRRQTNELHVMLAKATEARAPRSPTSAALPAQLTVQELIVAMTERGSPDFAELNEVIRRGPDAVPDLLTALQRSESWLVPKALGAIKDTRAVDSLITVLAQREWSPYKEVTVEALEGITGQKAGTDAQAGTTRMVAVQGSHRRSPRRHHRPKAGTDAQAWKSWRQSQRL